MNKEYGVMEYWSNGMITQTLQNSSIPTNSQISLEVILNKLALFLKFYYFCELNI